MMQQIEGNWQVLAGVAVLVLLVAVWLFKRASKPAKRVHRPDVLDEGVAPAQRNEALINTLPAAEILGGIGAIIDAAAHEEVVDAVAPLADPAAVGDDLSRIKGLGPKLKVMLEGLGVTSFSQIAAWSDADIARIDSQIGAFAGRPARDNWVEQAKLLMAGDTAAYEAKFGKI